MLDLQRAFDTVDHGILVRKLKAIAFNYLAVRWVTSNQKDRKQVVDFGGKMSQPQYIECPSRECLRPTCFPSIYKLT